MTEFGRSYFENYAGSGRTYDQAFKSYGFNIGDILRDYRNNNLTPTSLLDCGSATGQTVMALNNYGIPAFGIEISPYAILQVPESVKSKCWLFDMRNLSALRSDAFDSLYANSLMYLTEKEIHQWFDAAHKISRRSIYLVNPLKDFPQSAPPDPARKTIQSKAWWIATAKEHGFVFCPGTSMLFKKM